MNKKKNNKPLIEKISTPIMIIIMGLFFGGILIIMDNVTFKNEIDSIIIPTIGMIVLLISTYVQIIIHEAGHLIFGLISGYKFVSFRIGNLILIKQKNKLKIKNFKLAGTAGQCLMSPPNLINDKIPVTLFNLGGSLMNFIVSIILFIISYFIRNIELLSYTIQIFAIVGLLYAAQNGIPMKTAEIDNDGLNAISLNKHPEAQKAFWIQLKINENQSNGKCLKDMPEEWFYTPKEKDMKNSMIASIDVFNCNRLMEEHKFEEVKKKMKHLVKSQNGIVGIHKNLLINDIIYCELIDGKAEDAKKLINQTQKNIMIAMKDFPSIIRTQYAIALLLDKNIEKATEIKKKFIARGKTYPYPADIKSEKELIDIATNISKN